jgi:AcrR family transcriptional regulator
MIVRMRPVNPRSGADAAPERVRRPSRADVRRRLLDAALQVFAERGYANASLDEVAAAAGLTKGAIYSNFASKDEIFFAMLDQEVHNRVQAVRAALQTGSADPSRPADRRPATAEEVGHYLAATITDRRDWQLVFVDFWLRAVRNEEVRRQFLTHRQALRTVIAELVEQFLPPRPGPNQLSVEDAVTLVFAVSNGLAIEQNIDPTFVSEGLFGRVLSQLAAQPHHRWSSGGRGVT